jgi:methionyl-tRNA formyltransferase
MDSIVFIGSGHGGVVALKSLQSCFKKIEVISKDKDILSILREEDITVNSLYDTQTDLVVCAGYKSIISEDILLKKTVINTHPSLLPKYRGMHGLVWAMLNYEEELGFTIHLVNKYIDDGDILEQFKIRYNNQTSKEIMDIFDNYIEKNLARVVTDFINHKITPTPQDRSKATWVAKRDIEDCVIDFNYDNRYIDMLFKVLVRPYPLPIIKNGDKKYEINGYTLITRDYRANIGQVVNIEDRKVYIKVKEGLLIIEKLIDYDTKESISASDIFKIGKRL